MPADWFAILLKKADARPELITRVQYQYFLPVL